MKKKTTKIILSMAGLTTLSTAVLSTTLVSCVNNKNEVFPFPTLFNEITPEKFKEIENIINNTKPNFRDEKYVESNRFVLRGIKNCLNSSDNYTDINFREINQKNRVTLIENEGKILKINTILNNKNRTFKFSRENDIYFENNNESSISKPGFKNQWSEFMNFNHSKLNSLFIENFYKMIGIEINIENGKYSPRLVNGFYDNVNEQSIFFLYAYNPELPFDLEKNSILLGNIIIKSNKDSNYIKLINKVKNESANSVVVKDFNDIIDLNTFKSLWGIKNLLFKLSKSHIIDLINLVNTLSFSSINATTNMIGNEQEIFNNIETNISKLLFSIINKKATIPMELVKIKEKLSSFKNKSTFDFNSTIFNIWDNLINFYSQNVTNNSLEIFEFYNQLVFSINNLFNWNNYENKMDINDFNSALIEYIYKDNNYVLDKNFYGLKSIFNSFDFGEKSDNIRLKKDLLGLFVDTEVKGFTTSIVSDIANDWSIMKTQNNVYFYSTLTYTDVINDKANKIQGEYYLKVINSTNKTQNYKLKNNSNHTFVVEPNQALNIYLNLQPTIIYPKLIGNNETNVFYNYLNLSDNKSIIKIGVFDKNETNILDKPEFFDVSKNKYFSINNPLDVKLSQMTSFNGSINNVEKIEKSPIINIQNQDNFFEKNKLSIEKNVIEQIKSKFLGYVENIQSIKSVSDNFLDTNKKLLDALSSSSEGIKKIIIYTGNWVGNLLGGLGKNVTNILSIANNLVPSIKMDKNVLNTLNKIFPKIKKILNYVPSYYLEINGQKNNILNKNKSLLEMIAEIVSSLFKTNKTKSTSINPLYDTQNNVNLEPYALWDFFYDNIDNIVGVLSSIPTIIGMIEKDISNIPITNIQGWEPKYPSSNSSSVDSILPLLINNFYNLKTGTKIDLEEMKVVIKNISGIVPTIEKLLSNGGAITPKTIKNVTLLVNQLAATATSNGESILQFVLKNFPIIIEILKDINPMIGNLLNVMFNSLKSNQLDKPNVGGSTNNQIDISEILIKDLNGYWGRLIKAIPKSGIPNNQVDLFKIIFLILAKTLPLINDFINVFSNPSEKNNDFSGSSINLVNWFNENVSFNFNKTSQLKMIFNKELYFNINNLINKLNKLLPKNFFKNNINSKNYLIEFNTNSNIIFDVSIINPNFIFTNIFKINIENINIELNSETNFDNIFGFINPNFKFNNVFDNEIENTIKRISTYLLEDWKNIWIKPLLINWVSKFLSNTIIKTPMYEKIKIIFTSVQWDKNSLKPLFLIISNIFLGNLSNIETINNNFYINSIDPFNYVFNFGKETKNIDFSISEDKRLEIIKTKLNKYFGNSIFKNIVFNSKINQPIACELNNSGEIVYKFLLVKPAVFIKNNTRKIINGFNIKFSKSKNNQNLWNIDLVPIFPDSTLTMLIRNFTNMLKSSGFFTIEQYQKPITSEITNGLKNNIQLSEFAKKLIKAIENIKGSSTNIIGLKQPPISNQIPPNVVQPTINEKNLIMVLDVMYDISINNDGEYANKKIGDLIKKILTLFGVSNTKIANIANIIVPFLIDNANNDKFWNTLQLLIGKIIKK